VYFLPTDIDAVKPTSSWWGIQCDREDADTSTTAVFLDCAYIANAKYGVGTQDNSPIVVRNSHIIDCDNGIYAEGTRISIEHSSIVNCGDGIALAGRLTRNGPTFLWDCVISNSHPRKYAGENGRGNGISIQRPTDGFFVGEVRYPEEHLLIRECTIYHNWAHGIMNIGSYHAAVQCYIGFNGYRWSEPTQQSNMGTGIWMEAGKCVTHASDLFNNAAYGINVSASMAFGAYRSMLYEGTPQLIIDIDGDNCISENYMNVGAHHGATVFYGQRGRDYNKPSTQWLDYRNSMLFPVMVTNSAAPAHFSASGWSTLCSNRNYLYPYAPECYIKEEHSYILLNELITSPNDVRCGVEVSETDNETETGDEDIERALTKIISGSQQDSAWAYAATAFSKPLTAC
jgi:hypothetical protein